MASQPPFESPPVESGIIDPADWLHGEQIVSPVADWQNVPGANTTWYFSRWVELEGGVYTMKTCVDDACVWKIGPGLGSGLTFLTSAYGTFETQVYLPRGVQRLDCELTQVPANSPAFYIFSLMKDGDVVYKSEADKWLFDTTPIPDSGLVPPPDPRLSMPVWSILPNWDDGINERLIWLTDLLESEEGAEQRRSIRVYPRRTFEASFWRKGADRTRMDNFALSVGKDKFLVPLWHEQVKMPDGISIGSTGVVFGNYGTALREFREGDAVMVSMGNPADYDILLVGAVEETRFDWATPPFREWPPGTRIFPCRVAQLIDSPQLSGKSDRVSTARIRFELAEPDKREGAWLEYLDGLPLFPYIPDRADEISFDYGRNTYTLDNDSSVPYITDISRRTKAVMKFNMITFGRQQTTDMRNLLAKMRGRAADFYCPTFMHDIEPLGDIPADPWIDLQAMGFAEYQNTAQPIRTKIVIIKKDDTRIYRNITSIFEVRNEATGRVDYERFYLDVALPAIPRGDIVRISFVPQSRLDQDAVELYHRTAGSKAVQISLIMRAVVNNREA